LINTTQGFACADLLLSKKIGKIDLRYTSFCPEYHDSNKLKELITSLKSIQDEIDSEILILVNRVPIYDEDESYISLAVDTLRGFDTKLVRDFNSFYESQKEWKNSEINNEKVPYLERISYPMNINVSREDSTKKVGIKLIYNYRWDEADNTEIRLSHSTRIIKILNWAIKNIPTIKNIQKEQTVNCDYNNWKLSVISIPQARLQKIISNKSPIGNNYLYYILSALMVIMVLLFTRSKRR